MLCQADSVFVLMCPTPRTCAAAAAAALLPLWVLVRAVVSDAGCGGQVLLDSVTFGIIKDRLEELGQVRQQEHMTPPHVAGTAVCASLLFTCSSNLQGRAHLLLKLACTQGLDCVCRQHGVRA